MAVFEYDPWQTWAPRYSALHPQPISAILAAFWFLQRIHVLISLPLQMLALLLGIVFSPPPSVPYSTLYRNVVSEEPSATPGSWNASLVMRCLHSPPLTSFRHIWHHLLSLGALICKHHRGREFSPASSATSKEDLCEYLINEPIL